MEPYKLAGELRNVDCEEPYEMSKKCAINK